ncbi:hypothetical protein HDU83_007802, partial [Entophlyctis luteolus]
MMVIVSAGIGALIKTLILRTDPRVYGANVTDGESVNYYYYLDTAAFLTGNAPPGAAILTATHSCVNWFGVDFPRNSPIYEKNANLSATLKADSTYIPPPDGGWIGQISKLLTDPSTFDAKAFAKFLLYQQAGWSVVAARPGLESALGALKDVGPLTVAQGLALEQNATDILEPTYSSTTGLLGAVAQRVFVNFTETGGSYNLSNFAIVPYFQSNTSYTTDDDLDDAIDSYLRVMINGLAALNKSVLLESTSSQSASDLNAFYLAADAITAKMPYGLFYIFLFICLMQTQLPGALYLDEFDSENKTLRMVFHYGSDTRLGASSSFPSAGFRLLQTVAQIGQAALRSFSNGNATLAEAAITQGLRIFPKQVNTATTLNFSGLIGRLLYPFGV